MSFGIHITRSRRRSLLASLMLLLPILLNGCTSGDSAVADEHPTAPGRTFEFTYEATVNEVPDTAETAYLWVPFPPTTVDQKIMLDRIVTDLPYEQVTGGRYCNQALRFTLVPGTARQPVTITYRVSRQERARNTGEPLPGDNAIPAPDPDRWLQADRMVPIDGQIKQWATEVVAGRAATSDRARAIYDYAVDNLKYDKSGTGWGQGDIFYACDARHGNCTDFHAVFTGFARAVGIPARFEIGFPIPADRPEGRIGGYHCWAQFHTDEAGWVPVDASEASKHPARKDYFFGTLDRDRVLFTVGRDVVFPAMKGGPLNYFIYPYVEVDGKPWDQVEREFSYRDQSINPS